RTSFSSMRLNSTFCSFLWRKIMLLLQDKAALVTGAGRGIGFGFAKMWADLGPARLYCVDIADSDELRELRHDRPQIQFIEYDQGDLTSIQALFARIRDTGPPLYAAAMAAIFSERQRLLDADLAGMEKTIRVSVIGALAVLQGVGKSMVAGAQGGRIV